MQSDGMPMRWILENRAWLFDGLGALIVMAVAGLIWRLFWGKKAVTSEAASQTMTTNFGTVQAGRDVVIGVSPSAVASARPTGDSSERLLRSMPALAKAFREAVLEPECEFVREFFVLPNHRVMLGGSEKPRFVFYEEDIPDLLNQLDLLKEHSLLRDVTPFGNNAQIYRMTESLVTQLRASEA